MAAAGGGLWRGKGPTGREAKGLFFVFAVAVIWVVSSFAVKVIIEDGVSPFLLTYVANSLFAVLLPVHYLGRWLRKSALGGAPEGHTAPEGAPALTERQTLRLAAMIWAPWLLAQLTFNTSLALTSVTSNTILSSCSSLFTLLLSVWALREALTPWKLVCVLMCIAGTVMVTMADSESGGAARGEAAAKDSAATVGGDLLTLVSAGLYAAYTVMLKKYVPGDESVSLLLLFGYVGAINAVCLLPVAAIVTASGGGMASRALALVILKGLLDNVLSDYLWAHAVLLTTPTVATVGLSIQVPMALVAEVLLGSATWLHPAGRAALTTLGGGVLLGGFFGINLAGGQGYGNRSPSSRGSARGHGEEGSAGTGAEGPRYLALGDSGGQEGDGDGEGEDCGTLPLVAG